MSIELVMPSYHLILCCSLLLLTSIFPSIRVSSSELALHIRWPKYWSFSFSISPSNEYSGFPLEWTGLISLQSKELVRVFSNTIAQSINSLAVSFLYGSSEVKASVCNAGDLGSIPGLGRFPWRRKWQPTPVFLPGEFHKSEEPVGL